MFKFLRLLWTILLCERGEDAPADSNAGSDNGGDPNADSNADPNAGADKGAEGGQGQAPADDGQGGSPQPAQPRYGEYGDSPTVDQLFEALTGHKQESEKLKSKMSATERNLAAIRKTLESSGIRAVPDEDGNLKLDLINKDPQKRQSKFTDTHKQKFSSYFSTPEAGQEFLNLLQLFVEDYQENFYDSRQRMTQEQQARVKAFVNAKKEANDLMIAYFPMLDSGKKEGFNQAFYDRATELWQENYRNDPRGELLAALQAARELNVIPSAIVAAKKEGVIQGKAEKKILGPVAAGGGKGPLKGKLTREEYLKLDEEARKKYDLAQLQEKK